LIAFQILFHTPYTFCPFPAKAPTIKTFRQAATIFENEYEVITEGQRGPRWVEGHKARLRDRAKPVEKDSAEATADPTGRHPLGATV
jgi:hypothetical protein